MSGSGFRLERLLPFAVVAAAAVLFASNLMTTFELVPPGAEALAEQSAADQHGYVQMVLAVLAVVAALASVATASKPLAMAAAACGVVALLIFLLFVMPDANSIGTLDDPRQNFFEAEAVPQAGFWLELLGALGLALSGSALATLTSEQLSSLKPGGGRKPKPSPEPTERRKRSSSRRTGAKSETG
ncbi:MAG TPA: hypothetical protein VIZ31_11940 [Vicinamibacteria bacterium]